MDRRLRRRVWQWGGAPVAACLLALLGSCGLETVLVLSEPDYSFTDSGAAWFRFRIDSDNSEPEFRGIELYYRFYPEGESVPTGLTTLSDLLAAGFRRVNSTADTTSLVTPPLIYVPVAQRGQDSDITADFSPLNNSTPEEPRITAASSTGGLVIAPPGMLFRRGVPVSSSPNSPFKTFTQYASSDPDIKGLESGHVQLALYALSYGKQDLTVDAYSRAQCLYSVRVNITIE